MPPRPSAMRKAILMFEIEKGRNVRSRVATSEWEKRTLAYEHQIHTRGGNEIRGGQMPVESCDSTLYVSYYSFISISVVFFVLRSHVRKELLRSCLRYKCI